MPLYLYSLWTVQDMSSDNYGNNYVNKFSNQQKTLQTMISSTLN